MSTETVSPAEVTAATMSFADAFTAFSLAGAVEEITTKSVPMTEADRAGFSNAAGVFDGHANNVFVRTPHADLAAAESFALKLVAWASEHNRSSGLRSDDPRWLAKHVTPKTARKAERLAKAAREARVVKGTDAAIAASHAKIAEAEKASLVAAQAHEDAVAAASKATGPVTIAVRIAKVARPRTAKPAVDTATVTATTGEAKPAQSSNGIIPTPGLAAGTSPVAPKPGPRK